MAGRGRLVDAGLGLVVGVILTGLLGWGWLDRDRARLTQWADSTAASYQASADLLDRQRIAARQTAETERLARVAADLRADQARDARLAGDRDRARLRASLAAALTAGDSLPILVAVVAGQDSQIVQLVAETGHLREALRAEVRRSAALVELVAVGDSALVLAGQRIAGQDSVIRARLVPTPRGTLFGLPLPSRTVTFVVGLALGVVATR